MGRGVVVSLGILALVGCAEGSGDTVEAASHDASVVVDAPRDTIELAPTDAPPGTIFDADEAFCSEGSKATCKTSCGTLGDVTCVGGEWSKCTARAGDPCLGLDCKGKGDGYEHTWFKDDDGDGHGDPKKPVQACEVPAGAVTSSDDCNDGKSDVHPGATEVCNGVDDDCDGKTDDLPKIGTFDLPFSAVPPCTTADMASCKRGAYDWCRAKSSCFSGGFGPVELGPTNGVFVCVGDGTLTGTFADVVAAQPGCSSDALASKRVCESAVHRAGRAKGYGSAVLQLHSPSDWQFLGLPSSHATAFDGLVWSDLTSQHAGCKSGYEDSWDCNAASHRFCTSKGYVSGYGPVEYNSVNVSVVCVK